MQTKQLKAQILVVLLIALSILSIFVIVIASTTRRDVVERVQNEKYEQALSTAEEKLLKYVEGEILIGDNNSQCNESPAGSGNYQCTDIPEETSSDSIITKITTEDKFEITSSDPPLTVEKDSSLRLKLLNDSGVSYQGNIVFAFLDATSWMISVDYYKAGEGYKTVRDVYDGQSLFTSPVHCSGFLEVVSGNPLTVRVKLGSLVGNSGQCLSGNLADYQFLSLRLKPYKNADINTLYAESSGFPAQIRLITSESYSQSGTASEVPTVVLELIEPLYDSPLEILDYVLRSEAEVNKP